MRQKILASLLCAAMLLAAAAGCAGGAQGNGQAGVVVQETGGALAGNVKTPKYVFLFIGDGMSYPQVQAASYYLGAVQSNGGVEHHDLAMMDFPVAGSAMTYDATSFAPDSASTATSIATGNKTYSGTINMDTTMTVAFETISEKLKAQKDYRVGVISSVNLNHATPAAFYAHQASRGSYYEIGLEMLESNFEYFAGGALLKPEGDGTEVSLYDLAEMSGYKVAKTQAEAEQISADDEKVLIIAEQLDNSDAMLYSLDADESDWALADYVSKGIEVLGTDKGFFMMVEGGKIDWAGHANDAGANIADTLALDEAIRVAVDFYNQYPEETLILVTGDHETGGMSIGFAGTDYDLYLTNLENQKITYTAFDDQYVARYQAEKTAFSSVMQDVKELFGLMLPGDPDAAADSKLVLTDYEVSQLETAYQRTLEVGTAKMADMSQADYLLYGTYEPLSVTVTHILNNKSGIAFTSYAHTGLPVPVFAMGAGEALFEGYYDNTDIYKKVASLTGVQ